MTLSYTVSDLITAAYRYAGIIGETASATTEQLNNGLVKYNLMVKSWSSHANDTWGRSTATFSCTAAKASYLLGPGVGDDVDVPRPYRILNAYRTVDSSDVPITGISKNEYFSLSAKATTGVPIQFFYEPADTNGTLYIYPVPATADLPCTITLDYVKPIGAAALSDAPDCPDEWQDAVVLALALRFAKTLGKTPDPELSQMAQAALDLAIGSTYENAPIFIRPDIRGY